MEVKKDDFEYACQGFHKYFRTDDKEGCYEVYKAIDKCDNESYGQALKEFLKTLNIEVEE